MASLRIPDRLLAELDGFALGAYPEECCGILTGNPGASQSGTVAEVSVLWPAKNVKTGDQANGYVIAPEELLLAYQRARSRGEAVIGYYHSHPGASAAPSARDLAEAASGVSYLIVAVSDHGVLERRSWRLRPDSSCFDEEPLI